MASLPRHRSRCRQSTPSFVFADARGDRVTLSAAVSSKFRPVSAWTASLRVNACLDAIRESILKVASVTGTVNLIACLFQSGAST
jgi:hypothetical protein